MAKIDKLKLDIYYMHKINAQVLKLQRYDLILDKSWLFHTNPIIDWRNNTITFIYRSKIIKVQADNDIKSGSNCNSIYISRQ